MKKFWVMEYRAEDVGYSVVELTKAERDVVAAAINVPIVSGGGWCGSCCISDKSFESSEKAMEAVYNQY